MGNNITAQHRRRGRTELRTTTNTAQPRPEAGATAMQQTTPSATSNCTEEIHRALFSDYGR